MRYKKICILGLGYIGLPTASTFATHGIQVVGVDTNPEVIETLRNGGLHIHEPGLRTLVRAAIESGNLSISSEVEEADAFIIAVPTPFHHNRQGEVNGRFYKLADMRAVESASLAISSFLRRGNLVVLESTSPPRTTVDLVAPILSKSGLRPGLDFDLAYSPERVLPGQILRELIENARVIGGITPDSARAGADLYSCFVTGEIFQTDATTAEMVKLMENTFRDVNIALSNEFARLADCFGVDVWEAIRLANLHPRVKILNPGPGVGGHCISVDPWFLVEAAPDLSQLVRTARQVNDDQPEYVLNLVRRTIGDLCGRRLTALGLAYKPDVDDFRESPAITVVELLQQAGAIVKCYDPFHKPKTNLRGLIIEHTLDEALASSEAIILLVDHSQFRHLIPAQVSAHTDARVVFDTVNSLDTSLWRSAGFQVIRLGVGRIR